MADKTLRERCEIKLAGMDGERAPFVPDWQEIMRLSLPARGTSNAMSPRGGAVKRRANTASYDSKPARAARTCTNGMHTGLSSQASPWFKLACSDRDLMEFEPVKIWLAEVERLIYELFSSSNFYDAAKVGYSELCTVGVEACIMLEHNEYKAACHPLTAGEYWLASDHGLRVDTLYRSTTLTVAQMVGMFPWDKLTRQVRDAYDRSNYQLGVPMMHAIEPNRERDPDKMDARNKPYRSTMWEVGQPDKKILLRESGYDSKPFWAPRWETTGNDVYSSASPGFVALPDMRELQLTARRRGRSKDMLDRPPMLAPSSMAGQRLRSDPGAWNFADAMSMEKVKPLFETDYRNVGALREDQYELRKDVEECFFVDLFMAITDREGVQPLNDLETSLRDSEKFTQLGPVVDRVNIEKLEVAIDRAYSILSNLGLIPPAPPELEGRPLTVDFISMLAQAQRAAANTAIERTARFVGFIAGIFPDAAIKFDAEQAIDEFATGTGTPPKIVRSDEIVEQMREAQQAQAQQQQMAAMAQPMRDGAQAAELLSRTNVGGDTSLLQQMMGQG